MTIDSEEAVAALARRYPHWTIRISGKGRFWAVTGDPVFHPGGHMRVYLDADTPQELDELLAEQERLRGRDPYQDAVPQPRPAEDTA